MQLIMLWMTALELFIPSCLAVDHCEGPVCFVVDELDERNRHVFRIDCNDAIQYTPAKIIGYRCFSDISIGDLMDGIGPPYKPTTENEDSDLQPVSPFSGYQVTEGLTKFTTDKKNHVGRTSPKSVLTEGSTITSGSCLSGDFDAITRTYDGDIYAFKGSMVIKLTKEGDGVDDDFPRTIHSTFPGLPSDLDAAVFWNETGKTYFFKGDIYYQTSGTSLDSGYPRNISEDWGWVPSNIDAAVVWKNNGKTYFFKGDQYYRYNPMTKHLDGGYPKNITKGWPGLPSSVTAALQWTNPTTYLFVREDYYRYNDELDKADDGYPLPTSRDWLGCGASETTQTTCWAKKCSS